MAICSSGTEYDKEHRVTTDDQEQRTGGIPHAFGNAVAWKYVDAMSPYLKRGFLTMLYSMRQHAAPSGDLVFNSGERKPIKLSVLSRSAGCREKDGRRYIEAGIRAGVLSVVERQRGKATKYRLVVNPWPDWAAAEAYLRATSRGTGKKFTIEDEDTPETSGHCGPSGNHVDEDEGTDSVGATVAPTVTGHSGPSTSGHSGPDIPCVTQAVHHDVADVVTQPEVIAGPAGETDETSIAEETGRSSDEPTGPAAGEEFGRCEVCSQPLVRPGITRCSVHREQTPGRGTRRKTTGRPIQGPLLLSVPVTASEAHEAPQAPPTPRREAADPFAPARICGCGRGFRDKERAGRCPDCIAAETAETVRLTGLRGVSNA